MAQIRLSILLALLLSLICLSPRPSQAQPLTMADTALPPQLAQVAQIEPSTEVFRFKGLNAAQEIEIRRGGSTTILNSKDTGYLGVLIEWYVAPRPAPGSTYIVIERFWDGSQKAWGPYSFDPQAPQAAPIGPDSFAYLPLIR